MCGLNATGREYSFHSQAHNVYSRIGYFLLDGILLPGVHNAKYHDIIISDHCPVSVSMRLPRAAKMCVSWRFDPQLLAKKQLYEYLEDQMKLFFKSNDKDDVSPILLWETLKAYIRGCIISFQST